MSFVPDSQACGLCGKSEGYVAVTPPEFFGAGASWCRKPGAPPPAELWLELLASPPPSLPLRLLPPARPDPEPCRPQGPGPPGG